MLFAV